MLVVVVVVTVFGNHMPSACIAYQHIQEPKVMVVRRQGPRRARVRGASSSSGGGEAGVTGSRRSDRAGSAARPEPEAPGERAREEHERGGPDDRLDRREEGHRPACASRTRAILLQTGHPMARKVPRLATVPI